MKKLFPLLIVAVFLGFVVRQSVHAFTINGQQIGVSTVAATPFPVGSTTPVAVIACGTTLNGASQNTNTLYYKICIKGGTAGTDGAFCVPAPASSPCAAPSPAPNSTTQWGDPYPSGGAFFQCTPLNYPSAGGGSILSSRLDCVGTTSLSVNVVTLP